MANTKEIKSRMNSVKDTQKITNAMYLISSTKMRRAKAELDEGRAYFNAMQVEVKRIFRTAKDVESRYFFPPDEKPIETGAYAALVITADKGLAGAYNMNVIRQAEKLLSEHADTKLFVVGEYGRQYFAQHHIPVEHNFLYTAQNPTIQRARDISDMLVELYDKGEVVEIFLIYTDMKNSLAEEAHSERLLPFHRKVFMNTDEKPISSDFEFVPSVEEILDNLMPSIITGFIYGALVDSFCCEQNARMTAMRSANDNAEKLLGELSVEYNRVRQGAITQEITEVSAGAKAQKRQSQKGGV